MGKPDKTVAAITPQVIPETDVVPIGEMEHHAANEVLKMLLEKFSMPQVCDILKDMGQQIVYLTSMKVESSRAANEELAKNDATHRRLFKP